MSEWSERVVVLEERELFGTVVPVGFWDERRLPYLQGQFETMEGVELKFSLDNLRAGIKAHAIKNPSNPVREYLEKALAHWKNAGRPENIGNHLRDYFGVTDNVYTREVSRNFFISAAARAMAPGCPVPSMVVLEGAEGIGKSRWAPSLMPEDKGPLGKTLKWTSQMISGDLGSEKSIEQITGVWLCELEELKYNSRTENNEAKAFMTRGSDYRAKKYVADAEDVPRRGILYGTTNDRQYLKSPTGNRRYWPVEVVGFWDEEHQRNLPRTEMLTEDHKLLMWGEAMSLLPEDLGFSAIAELLQLSPEAKRIHSVVVEEKRVSSTLDDFIEDYATGAGPGHPMGRRKFINMNSLVSWLRSDCRERATKDPVMEGLTRAGYRHHQNARWRDFEDGEGKRKAKAWEWTGTEGEDEDDAIF